MKVLERLLLALLALLVITFISVLVIVPESVSDVLDRLAGVNLAVRLALVLVLDVLVLALVYLRLRPQTVSAAGLVVRAPGALADISVDSARSFIISAVEKVPDVVSTQAKLEAVRGKAKIEMDVTVRGREVNVPRKQQEINHALKQVINKQLGLDILGRPQVHIHLESGQPKPVASSLSMTTTPPKPESVEAPERKEIFVAPPLDAPPKVESETPVVGNANKHDPDDTITP